MRKRTQLAALALAIMTPFAGMPDVHAQGVILKGKVSVPGGASRLTIRLRDTSLREALQMIAEQKRLNLTLDESVSEDGPLLHLDFFDTPVNNILETILSSNGLEMQSIGSTYVVYRSGRYGQSVIRFIPLTYANATSVSGLINGVLSDDAPAGTGGDKAAGGKASGASSAGVKQLFATKVRPDVRSNGLIVSGQEENVKVVEQLVKRMDVLLPNRIFPVNHLTLPEAIEVLKGSFFLASSGAGASGAAAGASGGTGAAGAAAGAAASSAAGSTAGASVKVNVRNFKDVDAILQAGRLPPNVVETIPITEQTPRFVPLGNQNSLLVIGSQAELALVEQILKAVDRKAPQVLIKAQIVEIEQGALENVGLSYSAGARQISGGFDPSSLNNNGRFTFETMTNQAANIKVALDALVKNNKAKVLASPSVLAMDNRSSIIRITDDIIEKVDTQVTQNANQSLVTRTFTKGDVGITLEITPRIDQVGNVTMSVHPTISFVKREERSPSNQDLIATLKSTREFRTQEIRVKDGETIVIGGLIQDTGRVTVEKLPILGDIPFLGSLFRRTLTDTRRTEVQIFITPEIVKDASV